MKLEINVAFSSKRTEHQNVMATDKNQQINRFSTSTQLLAGAALVTVLALVAIKTMDVYTRWQNGNIHSYECRAGETVDGVLRDFKFFDTAAKSSGSATDEYCLGKMYETGNGTPQSFSEARSWYKKAADQGLSIAKRAACKPDLFEYKWTTFEDLQKNKNIFSSYHSQFGSLCCPQTQGPLGVPPVCPWQKERKLDA